MLDTTCEGAKARGAQSGFVAKVGIGDMGEGGTEEDLSSLEREGEPSETRSGGGREVGESVDEGVHVDGLLEPDFAKVEGVACVDPELEDCLRAAACTHYLPDPSPSAPAAVKPPAIRTSDK